MGKKTMTKRIKKKTLRTRKENAVIEESNRSFVNGCIVYINKIFTSKVGGCTATESPC